MNSLATTLRVTWTMNAAQQNQLIDYRLKNRSGRNVFKQRLNNKRTRCIASMLKTSHPANQILGIIGTVFFCLFSNQSIIIIIVWVVYDGRRMCVEPSTKWSRKVWLMMYAIHEKSTNNRPLAESEREKNAKINFYRPRDENIPLISTNSQSQGDSYAGWLWIIVFRLGFVTVPNFGGR